MIKQEDKKSNVNFISNAKKNLILNLDVINNILDTYRTNLNIVRYNLVSNDRIKDNQLPNFDFEKAKEIVNLLGNLLNGTIKNYQEVMQQIQNKTSIEKTIEKIKKGNKE